MMFEKSPKIVSFKFKLKIFEFSRQNIQDSFDAKVQMIEKSQINFRAKNQIVILISLGTKIQIIE